MLYLPLLLTLLLLLLTPYLLRRLRYARLSHFAGCSPPRAFPHKDPLFGLDGWIETGKMFSEYTFFPITLARFKALGKTFEMNFLGKRVIYTSEPENVKFVFSTKAEIWGVEEIRLPPMKPYFGRGFLTVDGKGWVRSRRHFSRSFERANVKDCESFDRHLSLMLGKIKDGETVDLQALTFALYTDTSTQFIFGESFESLSGDLTADAKVFVDSTHKCFEGTGIRQGLGPLMFLYRDPEWQKAIDRVHSFVQKYADKALDREKKSLRSESKRGKLFLDALAEETNDPVQLRFEAIHAFVAANETTANLISNIMWLLARRPELWARLRAEVLALGDVELDFDKPMRLKYLQQVINETLRIYPVFPWHIRQAAQDCILPTGGGPDGKSPIYIRAGDRLEASFLAQNRDPDIWGPDADEFKPERWEKAQPGPWEYVPFGGGPRSCLGREKALMETGYYVARMLREFKTIEARDEREWVGHVTVTVKNANGVHVALTRA